MWSYAAVFLLGVLTPFVVGAGWLYLLDRNRPRTLPRKEFFRRMYGFPKTPD
jgi:hypothetical protein